MGDGPRLSSIVVTTFYRLEWRGRGWGGGGVAPRHRLQQTFEFVHVLLNVLTDLEVGKDIRFRDKRMG